jgi:hypothetical protein
MVFFIVRKIDGADQFPLVLAAVELGADTMSSMWIHNSDLCTSVEVIIVIGGIQMAS